MSKSTVVAAVCVCSFSVFPHAAHALPAPFPENPAVGASVSVRDISVVFVVVWAMLEAGGNMLTGALLLLNLTGAIKMGKDAQRRAAARLRLGVQLLLLWGRRGWAAGWRGGGRAHT